MPEKKAALKIVVDTCEMPPPYDVAARPSRMMPASM